MEYTSQPQVSVIMPVYNGSSYVHEAIESVLNQTDRRFELIVIDDASTDDSLDIAKKNAIKDARVVVVSNEYEKGIVGALNTGLKYAKARYIARADADDINMPTRLQEQIDFLERYPDVDLVGAGCRVFSEKGFKKKIFRPSSSVELAWRMISDTYFCHPLTMFKKEAVMEFQGYAQHEAEDFDLFSRMIKKKKMRNIHKILLLYREHASNRSKESAQAIAASVYEIFLRNFAYYIGIEKQAELFYQFQHEGMMRLRDFPTITRLNIQILRKILMDYQMRFYRREVLFCMGIIFWLQFRAVLNKWMFPMMSRLRVYYRNFSHKNV